MITMRDIKDGNDDDAEMMYRLSAYLKPEILITIVVFYEI